MAAGSQATWFMPPGCNWAKAAGEEGLSLICTPKVRQKTFGYAYKTWNERKAYVCQHA